MRYPRLAAMRARRDAVEAELSAPYRRATAEAQQTARHERDARRGLEKLLASPMAKHVMDKHAHAISRELSMVISKAVAEATKRDPKADVFKVSIPKSILAFQDRKSIEAQVLERYLDNQRRDGSSWNVSADMEVERMVMRVRVTVPQLAHEIAVDGDYPVDKPLRI